MTEDVTVELPGVGTLIARGLGWGVLIGAGAGYLVPIAALVTSEGFDWVVILYAVTFFGLVGALVGGGYGLVAGGVIALVLAPFRDRGLPTLLVRTVAAVVGATVVAAISALVFAPDLSVTGSRAEASAIEDLVWFYAIPCTAAVILGYLLAPRLLAAGADVVEHHRHATPARGLRRR